MAYAVKADVENRLTTPKLVDLTDFEEVGIVNDARVTNAIAAATGVIDAYAAGRYALPLASSAQVTDMCVDLAIYKLYVGRQRAIPEVVQAGYDNAMKFLKDVSAGNASLAQAATPQTSDMDVVTRDHETDPETFDENKLESF